MIDVNFSNQTQNILSLCQSMAEQKNCSTITPYHLLFVFIQSFPQWVPEGQLTKWKKILAKKIATFENTIGQEKKIGFSEDIQYILQLADQIRIREHFQHIHPEHIWRALTTKENPIIDMEKMASEYAPHSMEIGSLKDTTSNESENEKTSVLKEFCINFTQLAKLNLLDPVIGRNDEIRQVIRILLKRKKNNPLLLGEAGVGKTAIIEGIAQKLVKNEKIPYLAGLKDKEILGLDLMRLIGGTGVRGELEKRLQEMIAEIEKSSQHYILFIDEIHNLVGAGKSEGAGDIANYLKPALARGEICVIGATTFSEYKRFIETDPALKRRFEPLIVREPTLEETTEILLQLCPSYEKFHHVVYDPNIIPKIPLWASNYFGETRRPDNAINLMDNIGAYVAQLSIEEKPIDPEQENEENKDGKLVSLPIVADFIQQNKKIDKSCILMESNQRIANLKSILQPYFYGQEQSLHELNQSFAPLALAGYPQKNVMPLMLIGESDSGKSSVAEILSEYLYPTTNQIYHLDLASYVERESLYTLIGPPKGIQGFQDGGELPEFVKSNPQCCLIISHPEYCHKSVLRLFLEILQKGTITDNAKIPYPLYQSMMIVLVDSMEQMERNHGTEFSRYIPHKIHFSAPSTDSIQIFLSSYIQNMIETFQKMGYSLVVSENVAPWLHQKFSPTSLSYQRLQDVVQLYLEDPLAAYILENHVPLSTIQIEVYNEEIHFSVQEKK